MTHPQTDTDTPLIKARAITLHVPVPMPNERKLLANPRSILTDFYLARGSRNIARILTDISFELKPGARLGLIGGNGAGKSTLLRLLAGIYQPSSGKLEINGRAQGLFDISLGMLPDATGLENIYLRGVQMGLSPSEVRHLLPEVLEFSELGEHIHKPVAVYSSGMLLRLAISISTMIETDILLLDEWIGAGDAKFNAKVRQRMMTIIGKSSGLVLATHNPVLMKNLCTEAIVLDGGKLVFRGSVEDALAFHKDNQSVPQPDKA